jgi:hypothetical protein
MSLDRLTEYELDIRNDERLRAIEAQLRTQWSEVLPEEERQEPKRGSVLDWVLAVALGTCLALALVSWAEEPNPVAHVVRVTT